MKAIARVVAAAFGILGSAASGDAQTLNMMKSLDSPHYDGHRTTWSPASDIINMMQDTLVALDWDGKTVLPYLANSWEVSPDARHTPSSCATTYNSAAERSSHPRTSSTPSSA